MDMENEISLALREYGLDDNEIIVFISLVGKSKLSAYAISKTTKIHKSTVYDILERLIDKGFISRYEENGKNQYSANAVNTIIAKIKDRENLLLSIIPKIEHLERKKETKISVLEGETSQKQFNYNLFNEIKNNKVKEILVIGNSPATHFSSNLFLESLLKEAKKSGVGKNIKYCGIWNEKFKKNKAIKLYLGFGENRFLPNLPTNVTTVIYGENIAYLFYTEKPSVIILHNALIAKENKHYFELLWQTTKK